MTVNNFIYETSGIINLTTQSATKIYNVDWTTYSSTITGFSGTPTQTVKYMTLGKIVIVAYSISGTSNATDFTFTVPLSAANTAVQFSQMCPAATDNGTTINPPTVFARITPATAIVILGKTPASDTWSSGNAKTAEGVFIYIAA